MSRLLSLKFVTNVSNQLIIITRVSVPTTNTRRQQIKQHSLGSIIN